MTDMFCGYRYFVVGDEIFEDALLASEGVFYVDEYDGYAHHLTASVPFKSYEDAKAHIEAINARTTRAAN